MGPQTLLRIAKPSPYGRGVECRVRERYSCDLETSCQPIAARADKDLHWPAVIRDVSTTGVGVVLHRRFERGTGLAVEIPPSGEHAGETLLARVIHVTQLEEGFWLHGCTFASELSEDEVSGLVQLAKSRHDLALPPAPEAPAPAPNPGSHSLLTGVQLEGKVGRGWVGRVPIRKLHLAGAAAGLWPVPAGTVLRLRPTKGPTHLAAVRIKVTACFLDGGHWKVEYTFAEQPSPRWLSLLGYGG